MTLLEEWTCKAIKICKRNLGAIYDKNSFCVFCLRKLDVLALFHFLHYCYFLHWENCGMGTKLLFPAEQESLYFVWLWLYSLTGKSPSVIIPGRSFLCTAAMWKLPLLIFQWCIDLYLWSYISLFPELIDPNNSTITITGVGKIINSESFK